MRNSTRYINRYRYAQVADSRTARRPATTLRDGAITVWQSLRLKAVERRDNHVDRLGRAIARAETVQRRADAIQGLLHAGQAYADEAGRTFYDRSSDIGIRVMTLKADLSESRGRLPAGDFEASVRRG